MGVSEALSRGGAATSGGEESQAWRGPRDVPTSLRMRDRLGSVLFATVVVVALLSLVVPTVIVIITAFDTRGIIAFPPEGFSTDRFEAVLSNREILSGARVAFLNACLATAANIGLAVPAAIALVRRQFPGKSLVLAFLMSPIMLPGVVIGVSVLFFYSAFGFSLSLPLLALSHMVFTFPFIVRVLIARMERADPALEEAAATLGARPLAVFRHVILPQLAPAMIGGGAFAFIISFDNVTVSLFTAPVDARPLPIVLFYIMRFDFDPIVSAVATLQIALTLFILAVGLRFLGTQGVLRR